MKCAERHGSYGPGICQNEREDYVECLHHKKLVSWVKLVKGGYIMIRVRAFKYRV